MNQLPTPRFRYYVAAAAMFASGIALGALITRSPIQSRVPGGRMAPALPALLPFAAAAAAFPIFIWLAHRAPLSLRNWRRALPLWLTVIVVVSVLADVAVFTIITRELPQLEPFPFMFMRLLTTGPLIAVSAAAAIAIENANARAHMAQAQLRSLTAQLRPHFLFNTLQSISTLVHRDANAADRMIGQLADLLRASLELEEQGLVPLQRELELTESYLAIVRERFGDRIHASVVATAPTHLMVPPFLLQPLVENAVKHGVEMNPAGGTIRVSASARDGALILTVANTTDGESSNANGTGIGLSTTQQRLANIYGQRAHLSLTTESGYTTVTVVLPAS